MYSIYTILHASLSSILDRFRQLLPPSLLEEIARQSGFVRRKPRKITPGGFLHSCLLAVSSGAVSLRRQAIFLGFMEGATLSKQGLHHRMGQAALPFLTGILSHLLSLQLGARSLTSSSFSRILIQDSTCLALPAAHFPRFPGSANAFGHSACARIQCVFDLLAERFVSFSLSPFTRNDQAAACDLLPLLRPGDLLLRDLGYFTTHSLQLIARAGAFFLTRRHAGTALFHPKTGLALDLLPLLSATRTTDLPVLLGSSQRLPLRLLAFPLPQQIADARRRKARSNRDRRINHSKEYYALLSWAIFLTNADSSLLPSSRAADLYRLRWRIEILFKSWKSHLGLLPLSLVAPRQFECLLCSLLILSLLFHHSLPCNLRSLSLLKLSSLFSDLFLPLFFYSLPPPSLHSLFLPQILAHCSYEKRRRNHFLHLLSRLC